MADKRLMHLSTSGPTAFCTLDTNTSIVMVKESVCGAVSERFKSPQEIFLTKPVRKLLASQRVACVPGI